MLTIDRLFNGVVLVAPLLAGALLTGVIFAGEEGSPLPVTIFQFFLILSFFMMFFKKAIEGRFEINFYGIEGLYLLFLAVIFFSIIYTPDREEALLYAFRFMALLLMTYLIYNSVESVSQIKWIAYTVILVAAFIALQNLFQIYANPEIAAYNYTRQGGGNLLRTTSEDLDPNIFAINFALPLMLLITFFSQSDDLKKRLFSFGLILLIVGSVLLTYSRSSWVSIGVGVLVIILLVKRYHFLAYMGVIFVIAFTASGAVQQLTMSFLERLMDIFAGSTEDSSKFRILLAKTAVLIILDSYMMGVGFQGFSSAFQSYHPSETTIGIFEPHNQYYAVFAELGIIGFIIFLFILYKIGKCSYLNIKLTEKNTMERALAVSLFATFVTYVTFYNFLGGMLHDSILFGVIGLIFVTKKLLDQDYKKQNAYITEN
jgi:O-antigen ligase